MDSVTRFENLSKGVCISHRVNTPGQNMNLTILPSAMGK